MKNLLIATAALATLIGTPALSADMALKAPPSPPAPVCMWCGFYIGLNAGAEWTKSDFTTTIGPPGFFVPASVAFIDAIGTGSARKTGFIGGGQIGYNWQTSNVVLGLEADFDGISSGRASLNAAGTTPGGSAVTLSNTLAPKWLATVRPRLGVAFNQVLVYATGGLAVLNSTYSQTFTNVTGGVPGGGGSSTNTTKASGVVGGGVEYAFNNKWSAKAEYLYSKFPGVTTAGAVVPGPAAAPITLSGTASQSIQTARAGINYRF